MKKAKGSIIKDISIESKNNKTIHCSECNLACNTEDLFTIDNRQVCRKCLFGNGSPVTIYPIGIVNNNLERDHTPFGRKGTDTVSKIELLPSQKRFMSGLDQEPEITIVYYLHKSRSVKTFFKRGIDGKQVGVFASRTPDRLSRIGIQDVSLLDIKGTTLFVKGLDAVSGTPVLDIKLKI
ncbi:TrmO family methyltransferase [Desulfobacula sp.]|uniref:TrmO family methyltransferase domain-containing protein n=1 Tax=Desulfobacula sp. TaxID=2593537 RepID=UPI0025C34E4A|nr:TrmO family methyltransferase [Desulfobacula sp.]MBC2705096.1 SAM-dependent methyltransferase [Desulfobacula sp.]